MASASGFRFLEHSVRLTRGVIYHYLSRVVAIRDYFFDFTYRGVETMTLVISVCPYIDIAATHADYSIYVHVTRFLHALLTHHQSISLLAHVAT